MLPENVDLFIKLFHNHRDLDFQGFDINVELWVRTRWDSDANDYCTNTVDVENWYPYDCV